MTADFKVVGTRQPLVDSWKKVAGGAVYGDDVTFPGLLHVRLLRSTLAHAKILRIDTSRAEAMPGVRGIVTGADATIPVFTMTGPLTPAGAECMCAATTLVELGKPLSWK